MPGYSQLSVLLCAFFENDMPANLEFVLSSTLPKSWFHPCLKYKNSMPLDSGTHPKFGRLSQWMQKECVSDGPLGLDDLFLADFKKTTPAGSIKYIRGVGFKRSMKKNTFFSCLPKRCWMGPPTLPERYKKIEQRHEECAQDQYADVIRLFN